MKPVTPLTRTPLALRRVVEEAAKRQTYNLREYAYTHALAFHPSGRWLIAAEGSQLVVLDLVEEMIERHDAHGETLCAAAFDESGDRLVTVGWDGTCCVWDFHERVNKRFTVSDDRIHSVAVTRDGRTAFMVGHEAVLSAFELNTQERVLRCEGHRLYCSAVGVSPDEKLVISSDSAGDVRFWTRTGECLKTMVHQPKDGSDAIPYWPVSIRFLKDGRALFACRTGCAVLVNTSTYRVERKFIGGHTKCVTDAVYLEKTGVVITASEDGCLSVWDPLAEDDGLLLTIKPHKQTALMLAVSPDERTVASYGSEGQIYLWDVKRLVMGARTPEKSTLIAKAKCKACSEPLTYVDPEEAKIETEQLACPKCGGMYDLTAFEKKKKAKL